MKPSEAYEILDKLVTNMKDAIADMCPHDPLCDVMRQRIAAIRYAQAIIVEQENP